jgi:hypothetical protein
MSINWEATQNYAASLLKIQDDISRIQDEVRARLSATTDGIEDWGGCDEMAAMAAKVREVSDQMFQEGEYSK